MWRSSNIMDRFRRVVFVTMAYILTGYTGLVHAQAVRSPDGKYEASIEASESGLHYVVKDISTGRVALTTYAQYPTANDVKVGLFSPDSKQFAAAYHYGHAGNYTWIGIWSVETGKLLRKEQKPDWVYDLSGVFTGQ